MARLNLTTCTKEELEEKITRAIKKAKFGMLYISFGSRTNDVKDQELHISRTGWGRGILASLELEYCSCISIINHMEDEDFRCSFDTLINELWDYIKEVYQ